VRPAGCVRGGPAGKPAQPGGRVPGAHRSGAAIVTLFSPGTFAPAPGRGRLSRMLLTQARTEFVLTLRNGEQVLLTLLIPLGLLVGLTVLNVVPVPNPRVDNVTPRILALAVMSTAFTGQAIALGFDRRYGVLKRLAATSLPRWSLVAGRMLAVLGVVLVQLVVLGAVAFALGWHVSPPGLAPAALLVLAGTAAFGALGVLLVVAGGIVLSVHALPGALSAIAAALPSGALADGLRVALVTGVTPWATLG